MDSRTSAATRIEVVTEGIFTRMLVADPELGGVAAVLFDEVHERSLESDLALALTLEAREALRPDLRLVLMSATLDGAAYEAIIPDLVRLESAGRMFPVEHRHIGRDARVRLEDAVASAVRTALSEEPGSVLVFLPGVAEIQRVAERLEGRLPGDVRMLSLHGGLDGAAQREAIAPAAAGTRKLVLATAIAETSITIDGVRVVIDAGLARRPRFDRAVGLVRLVTERAAQASVTQRAGRAGRTAPGVAIRLWEMAETAGRPRYDTPEILESDLTRLVLECARWGVPAPEQLRWLDAPPAASVATARAGLLALGALDEAGRVTPHGEALAALPVPPALGHMLVLAAARGWANEAARLAVLIGERGLGGRSLDAEDRMRQWQRERGGRAEAARRLASRWAAMIGGAPTQALPDDIQGQLLALAYPDRVARRRGASSSDGQTRYLMANGRAVTLPADTALARAEWIVVADAAGAAAGARVLLGAALAAGSVEALLGAVITSETDFGFDAATGAVTGATVRRLGAIVLGRAPLADLTAAMTSAALLGGVRQHGLEVLPFGPEAMGLRARASFARASGLDIEALDDAALSERLEEWLEPLLAGKRRLDALSDGDLASALAGLLGWSAVQRLDAHAPRHFETPAASRHTIDYAADGGPAVDVRVQALFGLAAHPMLAGGRVPLTLRLTSPAGRPVQVTRDLPGFWAGSWADVRRDLRGRYPKHPWPEDPANAPPTLRAKRPGQQA
jgi:ATP-dependent helicase HrpB